MRSFRFSVGFIANVFSDQRQVWRITAREKILRMILGFAFAFLLIGLVFRPSTSPPFFKYCKGTFIMEEKKENKATDQIIEDFKLGMQRNADLLKKQVLLEIIQVAAMCETYQDFRNTLYGMALGYLREFEDAGIVPKGTTDEEIKKAQKKDSK